MGVFETAQQFIDASYRCMSEQELADILTDVSRELGFDHFALVNHVDISDGAVEAFRVHNYPVGWAMQIGTRRRLTNDPVVLAAYTTHLGFRWRDVPSMVKLTASQMDVLAEALRQGIGEGFTVPSHIPGEANGSCSFAQRLGKTLNPESLPAAQLVGTFAFQAARRLIHTRASMLPRDPVKLTPRQLDCILLVARGKTDWEIATILGIKEETVTEYLNEARRRYRVSRRVQLVTRTIHDGHLTLADTLI